MYVYVNRQNAHKIKKRHIMLDVSCNSTSTALGCDMTCTLIGPNISLFVCVCEMYLQTLQIAIVPALILILIFQAVSTALLAGRQPGGSV